MNVCYVRKCFEVMHKNDIVVSSSSEMFINYKILFLGISSNIEDKEKKPMAENIQNIKVLIKEHGIIPLVCWEEPK
jgi:hypothetical protein